MRSDLDRLMEERGLDAFIIPGGETENPFRRYMLPGVTGFVNGYIVKVRGRPAIGIMASMEAEEARTSGLEILTYEEHIKSYELWKINDIDKRSCAFYERIFDQAGFTDGTVGVYGFGELGASWELMRILDAHFEDITFKGERMNKLFDEAVRTKDEDEIDILRDVGKRTSVVMQATWDFIAGHRATNGVLVNGNGDSLTVGDVKRFVRRQLLEYDLEDPLGMIFAPGREGGFPHSAGHADTVLKVGHTIVFDLFPKDINSGYFHDMTRTWSIGGPPVVVERAFEHTLSVLNTIVESIEVGQMVGKYNLMNYDMMEEYGYETPRSHPGTQIGAMGPVLGHGVGLQVHERPFISEIDNDKTGEKIEVGNVFTIEPGIYYPDKDFGIRIEDTIAVHADGSTESLTTMHKELVIPIKE
jgi:Xaa-Pro aminopeptidase